MRLTALDRAARKFVRKTIRKFGKVVVYREGDGTEHSTHAVFVDPTGRVAGFAALQATTTIRGTEEVCFIAGNGIPVEPDTDGRLRYDTADVQVILVKAHRSGEQIALWELVLRR